MCFRVAAGPQLQRAQPIMDAASLYDEVRDVLKRIVGKLIIHTVTTATKTKWSEGHLKVEVLGIREKVRVEGEANWCGCRQV